MSKAIIALWAEDKEHVIGRHNRLPWHLPKELKHFKETTMGQVLLMGRVTFEGMNRRVLPGRQTIVLTKDRAYQADNVLVMHSVDEVLAWFDQQDKNLFVVGGASIYRTFMEFVNQLMKTEIDGVFEGDTYFPPYDESEFEEYSKTVFEKDSDNPYAFTVRQLVRKVD